MQKRQPAKKPTIYHRYTATALRLVIDGERGEEVERCSFGSSEISMWKYRLKDGRRVRDMIQFSAIVNEDAEVFLCLVDYNTGHPLAESLWTFRWGKNPLQDMPYPSSRLHQWARARGRKVHYINLPPNSRGYGVQCQVRTEDGKTLWRTGRSRANYWLAHQGAAKSVCQDLDI